MACVSRAQHTDALVVDKPHLLEDGRLARLARTEEEHLDLIAQGGAVALELLFDLEVAWG
jgi:hypothetical protein